MHMYNILLQIVDVIPEMRRKNIYGVAERWTVMECEMIYFTAKSLVFIVVGPRKH